MLKALVLAMMVLLVPFGPSIPANPALAETTVPPTELQDLLKTLQMQETLAVLVEEGIAHGASIEDQMFPGEGRERWAKRVAKIYDLQTLQLAFADAFATALAKDPDTLASASAFFGSELGQEIIGLEIAARRAMLDEAVEEAARVDAERMQTERSPRLGLIRELVAAGDLIEMNVAGALGAQLAFLQGMEAAGGQGSGFDPEQLMTEVWSQEESVRDETKKWLIPYLALAYQPLSDAELEAYLAFSTSPAGKKVTASLFQAFEEVFRQVSFDLGLAVSLHLQGRDI